MTVARKRLVASDYAGFYHVTTRCVRRAFLCGDGFEHRKEWIYKRLRFLTELFPVDVAGYAVMSNHLHLVLRYDPTAVAGWSDEMVFERWFTLRGRFMLGVAIVDDAAARAHRKEHLDDAQWLAATREKMGSLGWFMRELKFFIALRANREDDCTGHFWESRYHSQALLDQAALAAALVYVDLNPIRAKMAETPESSAFVGVQERIQARTQRTTHPQPEGAWAKQPGAATTSSSTAGSAAEAATTKADTTTKAGLGAELRTDLPHNLQASKPNARTAHPRVFPTPDGSVRTCVDEVHPGWMLPIRHCVISEWPVDLDGPSPIWINRDDYLQLVDATGRLMQAGKRGAIPDHLKNILTRLDLDSASWLSAMARGGSLGGSALGSFVKRQMEATRRGLNWLANRCSLFDKPTKSQATT